MKIVVGSDHAGFELKEQITIISAGKILTGFDIFKAMALGADVVGGIPWIEYTETDEKRHIDEMLAIAKEHDADVSMLVDDAGDPGLMRRRWLLG